MVAGSKSRGPEKKYHALIHIRLGYGRFTPNREKLMQGLHRTPEGLRTDLRPKNNQTRGYSGVGRQGRMFLLCFSPEGHKLLLFNDCSRVQESQNFSSRKSVLSW